LQNLEKANFYLQMAMDQGQPDAISFLQNHAKLGNKAAQYFLGKWHSGRCEYELAEHYFRQAFYAPYSTTINAKQYSIAALYQLGLIYERRDRLRSAPVASSLAQSSFLGLGSRSALSSQELPVPREDDLHRNTFG
jgi:TPR repeat protein